MLVKKKQKTKYSNGAVGIVKLTWTFYKLREIRS